MSNLSALQDVEIEILRTVINICEKYSICYFLIGGSALGAIRHSGFIPWDDDIDIGIPRSDYQKFIDIAQRELGKDFFLQTGDTDSQYPLSFAKIRKSNTSFIEKRFSHLSINHGVYIDIFPLDGFPQNSWIGQYYYFIFKIYRLAILHKVGVRERTGATRLLMSVFTQFTSLSYLRKKIALLMMKYDYENCDIVINWNGSWGLKEAVPKMYFGRGFQCAFGDVIVTIPNNYDAYLKSLYGNYMVLPPPHKRVSHHSTDVIDIEKPYVMYIKQA